MTEATETTEATAPAKALPERARFTSSPWVPVLAAWLVAVVVLGRHQVALQDSLAYSGYLLFVILLPGRLLWEWLTEGSDHPAARLELWACGAAAGYVVELVSYPLARMAGHPRWYLVAPAVVVAVLGTRSWRARGAGRLDRTATAAPSSPQVAWGLAAVIGYLTVWMSVIVYSRYRLSPYRLLDEDEPFHLALVGELRHHFPAVYPQMRAGDLTYQWFPHAHMAASTWVTGIEPLAVYRRFDVLVLSIVCVLGTAAVAAQVTRRAWPGLLAGSLLVLVGSFDVTGSVVGQSVVEDRFLEGGLLLNSPTQTMAFALAPAVMLLCLRLLAHQERQPRLWWALLAGLAALAGTKVTFVPIFACGLVAAGVIAAWRRSPGVRAAVGGVAACGLVVVGTGALLYRGDTQSLSWGPGGTTDFYLRSLGMAGTGAVGNLILTVALLLGWLLSALGVVGLLRGQPRWDPRVWFLLGGAAAGLGATFLLFHVGMSQLYFGRSTAPLLAVACAWGFATMYPTGTPAREGVKALVAAFAGGAVLLGARAITEALNAEAVADGTDPALPFWVNLPAVLVLLVLITLARMLLRDLSHGRRELPVGVALALLVGLGLARSLAFAGGGYPAYDVAEKQTPLGAGALQAARWLRASSNPGDVVATNVHCIADPVGKPTCDSRHFWMSAFSERRFVLEGWAYTRFQEDWLLPFWGDRDFLERNDALFTAPSPAAVVDYQAAFGADWLLVDRAGPVRYRSMLRTPGLTLELERGRFAVFRVDAPSVAEQR